MGHIHIYVINNIYFHIICFTISKKKPLPNNILGKAISSKSYTYLETEIPKPQISEARLARDSSEK